MSRWTPSWPPSSAPPAWRPVWRQRARQTPAAGQQRRPGGGRRGGLSWRPCARGGATLLPSTASIRPSSSACPKTQPPGRGASTASCSRPRAARFRQRDPATLPSHPPIQACASQLLDGAQDHHRFGHHDEQGAGGDRGALAVRPGARAIKVVIHRSRSSIRWCSSGCAIGGPAGHARHARVPIACGLAWPERIASGAAAGFHAPGGADLRGGGCAALSQACTCPSRHSRAPSTTAVLNAANEVAVEAFCSGASASTRSMRSTLQLWRRQPSNPDTLHALLALDAETRAVAQELAQRSINELPALD